MNIPYNYVYIKPDPTDRIKLSNGTELYLSTTFEETAHAPSSGIVITAPDRLRFDRKNGQASMNFDVDMEVKEGDRVIFHYLTAENAKLDHRLHEEGFLVRYDQLYIAIRAGQTICLNGYIIVEPESSLIKTNMIIPDIAKKKAKQIGIVKYAGSPVRNYLHPISFDKYGEPIYPPSDEAVNIGDRVYFSYHDAVPLQQDSYLHGVLSKTILYKMQHKDVIAVLSPEAEILSHGN